MAEWHWELKPTYDGLIRAIELMSCGMIVEDSDGVIHYANARVLEWTGYVAEELDGKPVSMLVPEEFHTDLETERQRVLDGDLRTRLSAVQRKDGRTFPVAIAPQPFQRVDTGENAVLTILFDLGEVQTARPMGAAEDSLAADLAHVALKLQSMSFSASIVSQGAFPVDHPLLQELSTREREVLALLTNGARVPAIAKQLCISPNTVRNHLKAIYRKVDVSSQSDLVEWVRSLGAP
jgi:PAS domain S-box-containing protein